MYASNLHFIVRILYADMAELVDALDSDSNGNTFVQVQVLLSAPYHYAKRSKPFYFGLDFLLFTRNQSPLLFSS